MSSQGFDRRSFLRSALAAGAAAAGAPSFAQSFPDRPITAISPYTPGGMTETFFRPLWNVAQQHLGQKVTIEYKPGASGGVAAGALALAKPDGYTVLHYYSTMLLAPFMEPVSFNPVKDFSFIIALADVPYGVVVAGDSPYKTLGDLIEAARRNPKALSYGLAGIGTGGHIVFEEMLQSVGVQMTAVPYKGVEANVAVMGGHITAAVGSTSWGPQVRSGKLRLLAVLTRDRLKSYPDTPTAKELGFIASDPFPLGVVGPKGMSPTVVKTLHDALKRAIESPEMEQAMTKTDSPKYYMDSKEFREWAGAAFTRKGATLKKLGLAKFNPEA